MNERAALEQDIELTRAELAETAAQLRGKADAGFRVAEFAGVGLLAVAGLVLLIRLLRRS